MIITRVGVKEVKDRRRSKIIIRNMSKRSCGEEEKRRRKGRRIIHGEKDDGRGEEDKEKRSRGRKGIKRKNLQERKRSGKK